MTNHTHLITINHIGKLGLTEELFMNSKKTELPELEREYINDYYRLPNNYNAKSIDMIRTFGKRLKEIRKRRSTETDPLYNIKWTGRQKDLAEVLGISTYAVSKYEKGNELKSLPDLRRLIQIALFYNVTVHYLLGYTDDYDKVLSIDEYGEVERDKNGKPVVLKEPMSKFLPEFRIFVKQYKSLYLLRTSLFTLIGKLMNADDKKQKIAEAFLKLLLEDN